MSTEGTWGRRGAGWLGLLLGPLFGLLACGDTTPPPSCGACPDLKVCINGRCESLASCTGDSQCVPGHPCLTYEQVRAQAAALGDRWTSTTGTPDLGERGLYCSPNCDSTRCPPRQECVGAQNGVRGECRSVACGTVVRCDGDSVCDAFVNRCYPWNGECREAASCPQYDGLISARYQLECREQFCHIGLPPQELPDLRGLPELPVLAPSDRAVLASDAELELRWPVQEPSVIALVLTAIPTRSSEIGRFAIWGAALPGSSPGALSWGEGQAIRGGTWQPRSEPAPREIPLYLVLQAVRSGQLLAVSRPIQFLVGQGRSFQHPGDACSPEKSQFCDGLTEPLVCLGGSCRVLCASHRDCMPFGLKCSLVTNGNLRFCE